MVHIIGQQEQEEPKVTVQELIQAIQFVSMQNEQLRQFVSAAAKKADINSLTISALAGFIVDKGIATDKELQDMIQKNVVDVYKKMEDEAKNEAAKRQQEMQNELAKEQDLSNNAIKEAQEAFQKNRKNKS